MPRSQRSFKIRAALRGSLFRNAMRCVEMLAKRNPDRYPYCDRDTRKLKIMDITRFGRYETVTDGVGLIYSFANVGIIIGTRGVVLIDTSSATFSKQIWLTLRAQTSLPIEHIIFTHGHIDHVTGVQRFLDDAAEHGFPRPTIWGHEKMLARFDRYERMPGWITEVNRRQFGSNNVGKSIPASYVRPDYVFSDSIVIDFEGEPVELYHADAETDDAAWVWLPQRGVAYVGDLLLNSLPNTGNPNKVQRNTLGWAMALEAIAAKQPQHLMGGHFQPIAGDQCQEVLIETARALRYLHDAVVDRLNAGRWPEQILSEKLQLPEDLRSKPYLREVYGCCEFVVRDVLRQYAGWWTGHPAELFPLSRAEMGAEMVGLVGADRLRERIRELMTQQQCATALPLAVMLTDSPEVTAADRDLLATVLEKLSDSERSFIARNLFAQEAAAAKRSQSG
ncbi:MBL fold metallo-hydrolase [bacterium]|nr:MBL fold metallo-hydrolase [bacterium]